MVITSLFTRRSSLTVAATYLLTDDGEQILTEDSQPILSTNPPDPLFGRRSPLFTIGREILISDRYGLATYGLGIYAPTTAALYGTATYDASQYA